MKSNRRLLVGMAALAVFGTVAFLNFRNTMAPYVSFAEARASTGAVQVGGFPDHPRARFDMVNGTFHFSMKDEHGEEMRVSYAGAKPGNFDQAEKVVVVGRFENGTLNAAQILVKCPSKYEAEADKKLEEYKRQMQEDGTAPSDAASGTE